MILISDAIINNIHNSNHNKETPINIDIPPRQGNHLKNNSTEINSIDFQNIQTIDNEYRLYQDETDNSILSDYNSDNGSDDMSIESITINHNPQNINIDNIHQQNRTRNLGIIQKIFRIHI